MIEYLPGRPSSSVARELADLQARAYKPIGIRPWTSEEIEASTASPHVFLLIARDPCGAARGFVCFSVVDGEGEILVLAVDPDHRRRGLASKMLDEIATSDEIVRIERLVLEVAETNIGAIALYEMSGFTDIAIRYDYYRIAGNRIDAKIMARSSD